MTDDKSKAEELLAQSKQQKRHETEPTAADDTPTLEAAIVDAYERIDDGDAHTNLTVRDADLAALVSGLEVTDELETIVTDAQASLERDTDSSEVSRAKALGLVLRVGLLEIAPETIDTAVEARKTHLSNQASEF